MLKVRACHCRPKSITVVMITIIWWQQLWSWWWQWRWWWLVPNIDGDGMLLQVQDRKYWSRPTPTTWTVKCISWSLLSCAEWTTMCYGTMKSFAHCATRAYIVIHLHVCVDVYTSEHMPTANCRMEMEWDWWSTEPCKGRWQNPL